MKVTSKIFIVFALLCVSAAAAYSQQDCNSHLRQAMEMVSQKKYCDAKTYYQRYSNCNADADVSTEIAMCERFCKINVMEGVEVEPVGTTERDVYTPAPTGRSSGDRTVKPVQRVSTKGFGDNARFKLGVNGGALFPYYNGKFDDAQFGGGISGEYLVTPNIGAGLNVGYYSLGSEKEEYGGVSVSANAYLIPVALTGKYYFLTKNIQPYAGVDVGLYTIGAKLTLKYQGERESESDSESYFGLAPVAGLQFKLSNNLALDVNAKYNLIFSKGESTKLLGVNVGIVYSF